MITEKKIIVLVDRTDMHGSQREFTFRVQVDGFEALVIAKSPSSRLKKERVAALGNNLARLVQELSAAAGNTELIDWSPVDRA